MLPCNTTLQKITCFIQQLFDKMCLDLDLWKNYFHFMENYEVKKFLVGVEVFSLFIPMQLTKSKYSSDKTVAFLTILLKTLCRRNFGLIKEGSSPVNFKKFAIKRKSKLNIFEVKKKHLLQKKLKILWKTIFFAIRKKMMSYVHFSTIWQM